MLLFTPEGNSVSSWRAFEVDIRALLLNFSRYIINRSWSPVKADEAICPALSRRLPAPAPVTVLCPLAPVNIPIMFCWKAFFPPVGVFLALLFCGINPLDGCCGVPWLALFAVPPINYPRPAKFPETSTVRSKASFESSILPPFEPPFEN